MLPLSWNNILLHILYKQLPPLGTKICSDICPRTLSAVPRSEQFSESENCELRGTDNVQGQISGHIFAPNGGYCLYYPSNPFRNARNFEIGQYLTIILRSGGKYPPLSPTLR